MLQIVTREAWYARQPRTESALTHPIAHVFWMNAPRDECVTRQDCVNHIRHMQEFHMNVQNQRDIRPNFLVASDGTVYEGRGWYTAPLLPINFSSFQDNSIIIGFIGEYEVSDVPDAMHIAAQKLVSYGVDSNIVAEDCEIHNIMIKGERMRNLNPISYN